MIVIPEKNAVALALREPERVTTLIPHAKTIEVQGRELVVVKHGLDETKLLRNLGIKIPSPIRYHYAWSGSYTPFEAQRVTAEFLTLCNRAYVLNDIGTGKSLSTLWAYDYLHRIGNVDSVLIVAPLSTIELTWGSEIFRHFPHLDYQVLHGDRAKRLRLLDQDADVYIVNHDGVKIIKDALKDRDDINLVVVDELTQVARNSGTDRWRALNAVINKQKPRKAWGLTGAPIPNSPLDAWAQCRLLTPETVPAYSNKFRDMVLRQLGPYRWEPRDNAVDTVNEVMRPSVRFSRDDCIDLPPVMYETRSVAMTTDQAKAYKEMLNKMRTEADNNEILAVNEAVKANKLVQIACGVAYSTTGEEVSIPAAPRLAEVDEIITACAHKVIVFVPFVSAVNSVAEYLRTQGHTAECIHGGVSKAERERIFREFQHGESLKVLVAQPAAMSHGLTLTAASTIVWYAPVNSNDTFVQANGRITRPGQKNDQFIIMIEGSSIERRMYERLKNRQQMQGVLLDLVRAEAG